MYELDTGDCSMSSEAVKPEAANTDGKTVKAFALVQNAVITPEGDMVKFTDKAEKRYPAVLFISDDRDRVVKAKNRATKSLNNIRSIGGQTFEPGIAVFQIAEVEIPAPRKREAKPTTATTTTANGSKSGQDTAKGAAKK